METKKKKWKVLLITLTCISLALAVALTTASVLLKTMAYTYLGRGPASIVQAEGSENWNTDYYSPSFATKEEAAKNGEKVTEALCNEGFVLLKNSKQALPLNPQSDKISLIGRGAVDPLYGGSGSGNVDASKAVTPYTGIQNAGFTLDDASYRYFNTEKSKYQRCSITMDDYQDSQWLIGEVAYSGTGAPFTVANGSVAVYVVSRAGGEGWDLSNNLKRDARESRKFAETVKSGTAKAEYETYEEGQHQLELSAYEKNWIEFCKANYAKTVVVINSSNAMELGALQDDDGVDAVLWVGGPGSTGFNALGSILAGKVNPSGRTADIYPRDFTKDPTFPNAAAVFRYTDLAEGDVAGEEAYFTQYEEGIYLGYRYYETAAQEGTIDYSEAVVYPFGYGLSYTTFSKKATFREEMDKITVSVTVKNTGSKAGKEVVQLYNSAPYTEGGIEKPAVVLVDFAKTKLLEPNAEDTLTLSVNKRDLASYDDGGVKIQGGGYVLEKGKYVLSLRENSHEPCAGDDMKFEFTVPNDVLYTENVTEGDGEILMEKQAARNRFRDVTAIFRDDAEAGYARNMSRADFQATFPTAPTEADSKAKNITLTYDGMVKKQTTVAELLRTFDPKTDLIDETAVKPRTGAQNGLALSNMRGVGYHEKLWDEFLDQLTESDYTKANEVLINGAYNTGAIDSLGKGGTVDFDGPQGFTTLMGPIGCCAYCSEVVIASTFNTELAKEMGVSVGEEALASKINGWYGPALNLHRSPFSGRNFEYYSEDPFLSGKTACAVVEGAADKGCYGYIKHFALNDTEIKRVNNNCTWAREQAIRELYLAPFRYVVERAETQMKFISDGEGTISTRTMPACTAVMSSFNRIGATWAGGSRALLTDVLRNEWGFRGLVISDFNLYPYMFPDQGVRAGGDLQLTWTVSKENFADTESATARQAIRTAYKNMCYTVVNSNYMQNQAPGSIVTYGLAWWQILVIVIDIIAGLITLGTILYLVLPRRKS